MGIYRERYKGGYRLYEGYIVHTQMSKKAPVNMSRNHCLLRYGRVWLFRWILG
jgi:ribosomal protein S17